MIKNQFVKLSNSVLVRNNEPGVLALYALAAFLFTLPGGYHAPAGGFKQQAKRYNRKGARFEPSWRTFREYYLDLFRTSLGSNHYDTLYDLQRTPRFIANVVGRVPFLPSEKGHTFAVNYAAPTEGYVEVPLSLLMDTRLSIRAKGILILLLRELELAKHIPDYVVSKDTILRRCGLSRARRAALTTAWEEAKESGYLRQRRAQDAHGHSCWVYAYRDQPFSMPPSNTTALPKKKVKVTQKSATPTEQHLSATVSVQVPPLSAETRTHIRELVKVNLESNILAQRLQEIHVGDQSTVDGYVDLITDVLCSQKTVIRIGGEDLPAETVKDRLLRLTPEHILYVAEQISRQYDIRSPRAYKLTALYHSTETHTEYALGMTHSGT